jgi:hypothetical protein
MFARAGLVARSFVPLGLLAVVALAVEAGHRWC